MKIENGYNSYLNAVRQSKDNIPTKNLSSKTEQVKKENSVQVNISDTAKKMAQAKSAGSKDIDIEAIKKSVMDGTYSVSPEKIAQGMINAMNEQGK
ncbi:anti-sigma-28 factor, FlgM family [Carnobacterium iners]|uniref:Negative regulator of flagellin synthesis n=1 Tax=Carnobacterium iners TaxID=1073423 RepID=A0A1X7MZW4_9LACT|nr:flagellar biosynthesis anti-sigma factor FlgM [Carnobacterium iners]SEK21379.1 anti-sigma-28 factor, FlgM family [Carnobacterium iners]SMH30520.1 anti-sigma-28 factor, FlgM family [Carnobacterium iners]